MNKFFVSLGVSALLVFASVSAYAEGTFLCMEPDESIAVTADINHNFKYVDMIASNGERVYPTISADGNTYLPFRYVCEMAGLKDGANISGELPDGYFRFWDADPNITNDKQKIEIKYNGEYYCHNVNEPFQYTVSDGDIRTVSIYNINGSLYFPMRYIAMITNSTAMWLGQEKRIIFASENVDLSEYVNESATLNRKKELYLGFDFFYNNLGNSPLYLKSDGDTIQNLSYEIEKNSNVKSVTRLENRIYFIDDNKHIYKKIEDNGEITKVNFTDRNGNNVDVLADTIVAVKNKLYGIKIDNVNNIYGSLFSSKPDGTDFEYITNQSVYNMIVKKNKSNIYLFYCDASSKEHINMIDLKTMDNYEVQITDYEHNNLLYDIKKFVIGDKTFAYIDGANKLHIIDLEDNLEDFEIIRVNPSNKKIFVEGNDGEKLNDITSINCDYYNNIIYITQVDNNGKLYYYTNVNGGFERLEKSDFSITDVALFKDADYNNICAKTVEGKTQIDKITYSDGTVSIAN